MRALAKLLDMRSVISILELQVSFHQDAGLAAAAAAQYFVC